MTTEDSNQPTPREILDAVLHSQTVMAAAIGRLELEMGTVKADVATIKSDIIRLERRVIRLDDRVAIIENQALAVTLTDHERRITRLEGLATS